MSSYQHYCVTGNVVHDPKVRVVGGVKVAEFTVVVETDRAGERDKSYLPVECWGNVANSVESDMSGGQWVLVSGKLKGVKHEVPNRRPIWEYTLVADSVKFLNHKK